MTVNPEIITTDKGCFILNQSFFLFMDHVSVDKILMYPNVTDFSPLLDELCFAQGSTML